MILEHGIYDKLRLFLFSKNELKIRHKFVGEANITNTHSYRGDDSDDLIVFANDIIREVNEMFEDIERLKPEIDGIGLNIYVAFPNLLNDAVLYNTYSIRYGVLNRFWYYWYNWQYIPIIYYENPGISDSRVICSNKITIYRE